MKKLINESRIPIRAIITVGLLPSPLKVIWYRLRGAKIGNGVSIGFGTVLVGREIVVGDHTQIGFGTIIRGRVIHIGRHVRIGSTTFLDVERIEIGDEARINEQVFAGGPTLPESALSIGKRTIVMQQTFLNPTKPLVIGDGTGIGGKCSIFTHGSWQNMFDGYPVKFAPVTLGRDVWIPWDCFIMPGVTIGDGATIGAGSLVTRDIPARSLAAGSPAKVLKGPEDWPPSVPADGAENSLEAIVAEFTAYLEYFGFECAKSSDRAWTKLRVSQSKRSSVATMHLAMHGVEASPEASRGDVVLSLYRIADADRLRTVRVGAMWIDMEQRQRSEAHTPLGEELALFLSRYGVRCDRIR